MYHSRTYSKNKKYFYYTYYFINKNKYVLLFCYKISFQTKATVIVIYRKLL